MIELKFWAIVQLWMSNFYPVPTQTRTPVVAPVVEVNLPGEGVQGRVRTGKCRFTTGPVSLRPGDRKEKDKGEVGSQE